MPRASTRKSTNMCMHPTEWAATRWMDTSTFNPHRPPAMSHSPVTRSPREEHTATRHIHYNSCRCSSRNKNGSSAGYMVKPSELSKDPFRHELKHCSNGRHTSTTKRVSCPGRKGEGLPLVSLEIPKAKPSFHHHTTRLRTTSLDLNTPPSCFHSRPMACVRRLVLGTGHPHREAVPLAGGQGENEASESPRSKQDSTASCASSLERVHIL